MNNQNEDVIGAECERGEDIAKGVHADATRKTLPSRIASLVQKQSEQALAGHNEIRALEKQGDEK